MDSIKDTTNNDELDNFDNLKVENQINGNIDSILDQNIDRQILFDRFLTYRRRMARLASIQAIYLYDFKKKMKLAIQRDNLFNNKNTNTEDLLKNDALTLCQDVIYFYRNVFFNQQEYGWTKKNKKIDENFMYELVKTTINNVDEIDGFISAKLNPNWTISKLDATLHSIIRCAVAEIMLGNKIEKAVLSSEYTNISSDFFNGKEIGFINGITDKLYDDVKKKHPFITNDMV